MTRELQTFVKHDLNVGCVIGSIMSYPSLRGVQSSHAF